MIESQRSTKSQEFRPTGPIEAEIAREPTARLLDVGAGLVKGQREAIELRHDLFGPRPIIFVGRLQYHILCDARSPAQYKERTFLGSHLLNLDASSDCTHSPRPGGQ